MTRVLKQSQNNAKALELRLEQHGPNYHVILAGLTFNLRTGCSGGTCDYTNPDNDFFQIENETYKTFLCTTSHQAYQTFDQLKLQFID